MQRGTETRQNLSLSLVKFPHLRVQYNYTNPVGDKQKQKQLAMWPTAPGRCAGTLAGQESLVL